MGTYLQDFNFAAGQSDLDKRVGYAVTKYARYILGGGSGDQTLIDWAKTSVTQDQALTRAAQMRLAVVEDVNFSNANADTPEADDAIQSIVETLVNAIFKNI